MFAAERQLLDAAHRSEVATRSSAISGYFSALLASAAARIIAHVNGRIAQIDPTLTPSQRQAAIAHLQAEQVAALARLRDDIGQERRVARRAAIASLILGHRMRKSTVARRQSAERAALSFMFRVPSQRASIGRRKLDPVHRLVARIAARTRKQVAVSPGTR